jgi:Flp pilus assembly protein TadG
MRLVARLRSRLRDDNGARQRGAVLVEFVLIAPVLVLITAAIFEYGLAFRDSMTLSNALRSGARVGSNAGRERQADYTILKSVEAAMTEVPNSRVNRIIVYKAATSNSAPPAACLAVSGSGGVNGVCNVYLSSDLARPLSDYAGTTSCTATSPDRYWCPTSRQNQQALGADYLGVWMEIRYNYVTHVLPGTGITIRDRAVMRLEPRLN